ncbi:sensor histidine kinase [Rhodococcus sp. NPDC058514]
MRPARRGPGGLGLRGRVILSFAVGAGLVSLMLSLSVFTISRGYMEGQRERSAERQATTHADFVRNLLDNPNASAAAVLGALDLPVDAMVLLHSDSQWFSSDPKAGPEILPEAALEAGAVAHTTVHGQPYLAVAVPLDSRGDILYELAPTIELHSTLRVLRVVLILCALAATACGAAFGFWASRRVLAPLHQLAGTAARIAGGELDTRLPDTRDRDLATIIDSFNAMIDSLQQRIERERRFFGDVSHELRTPLTTLVTSVGVLGRNQDDLPDRSRRALHLITAELDHLRRLLDDLLALARSEAGLHQDDFEPMAAGDLLKYTLADSRRPAHLLRAESDVRISGRKLALERAFLNLMDNADRHGRGLIGVTVRRVGTDAVVLVDDAGPGVAESERTRIFERFATAHPGRRSTTGSGTGLGLALVAETVAAHGGRVECVARPGGGARFVVTLPGIPTDPTGIDS